LGKRCGREIPRENKKISSFSNSPLPREGAPRLVGGRLALDDIVTQENNGNIGNGKHRN